MNVGPVPHSPSVVDAHESGIEVRPAQPRGSTLGNSPFREVVKPPDNAPIPPTVQDEVKLQWDSSDQVRIYQFVNQQSGALILQVPSEEVLNVDRGIQESLQNESLQREALREEIDQRRSTSAAPTVNERG